MTLGKPWAWRMLRNSKVSCTGMSPQGRYKNNETHHFKTIRAIDHKQNEVRNFGNVDHGIEVIIAFNECNALLLSADDSYRALYVTEGLFSVASNERLHERGLADAGWADNCDDGRRGLVIGSAVDEGDMKTSLVALSGATTLSVCPATGLGGECLERE